jgi:hypothetical protein
MRIAVDAKAGLAVYHEDYDTLKGKLEQQFQFVQPMKVKHSWSFECFAPKQGTMQEAFDGLSKRYHEVGWVNDPD